MMQNSRGGARVERESGEAYREGSTMPKLMKAVTVKKPVHEVFEYVDQPAHLPEIWPSLFEVKDVQFTPQVRKFQWFYNFARRGDVVNVANSPARPDLGDPGTADWNIPWEQWVA